MDKYLYYLIFSVIEMILWPFSNKKTNFNNQNLENFGVDKVIESRKYKSKCYIIGRGPSLDKIDNLNLDDGVKICINDTFRHVNNPDFIFWHDACFLTLLPAMKKSNAFVVLPTCLNLYEKSFSTIDYIKDYSDSIEISLYNKINLPFFYNINKIESDFLNIENSLIGISTTSHSAIWFTKKIGCKKIVFIGMDGKSVNGRTYSLKYEQQKVRRVTKFIYAKSRFENILLCKLLNIDYEFI